MDPVTGRFVSEDPARRGTNWVAYCSNSPTCGVDRNGRDVDWINTVFNGPEWFIDGLKSSWQEGIEQFIEFIEEHWQFAVINFAAGRSATIAGELMLRLYVNELDLAEAAEMGEEVESSSMRSMQMQ